MIDENPPKNGLYISYLTPFNQFPKEFIRLVVGEVLNVIRTILHKKIPKWHAMKRCCIISSRSQKQHFLIPCEFRLARLSFVRITLR
jgi:hypothetical protein